MKPTHLVLAVIALLLSIGPTSAQSTEGKIELGPQFTSLTLFQEFGGDVTEPGFGARLTYNINRKIALEAEGNFFPNKNVFGGLGEGRAVQAQFGVKVGKRFSKFGVFGKARPGFLSVGEVFINEPGATLNFFLAVSFRTHALAGERISRPTWAACSNFTQPTARSFASMPATRSFVMDHTLNMIR